MGDDRDSLDDVISNVRAGTATPRWRPAVAPAYVYLLADNLDASLAAGEDLLVSSFYWLGAGSPPGETDETDEPQDDRLDTRSAVERLRSLEATLVARVLKSRERAEEIAKRDGRFRQIAKLYTAGTAILVESVVEFGDTSRADFETGGGIVSYLRQRGLIPLESPAPAEGQRVAITENFLVARRVRLGSLMDLVAMFLDALEGEYDLYADVDAPPAKEPPAAPAVIAALDQISAAAGSSERDDGEMSQSDAEPDEPDAGIATDGDDDETGAAPPIPPGVVRS